MADTDADVDVDAGATDAEGENADGDAGAEGPLDALATCEGWRVEGFAARVHYRGAGDHYSVEYYHPSECVLYWKVKGDGETAVPVGRDTVPDPLRERVRLDLSAAGIDPEREARTL